MKKVLKGKIKLLEQEGGYAAPAIYIGEEEYLDNILLNFPHDGADMYGCIELEGEYKITIERLEIK